MSRMLKLKPPIRKPVIVLLLALLPSFFLLTFKGKMTDVSAYAGSTTLVIDPGHGGIDGGAQGADGSRESDINLAIALKLRALAEFYGQDNIMTRQDDSTKSDTPSYSEHRDLECRTEIVNEAPNPVLISIHQNCFPTGVPSGPQVMYAATQDSEEFGKLMHGNLIRSLAPENRRVAEPASKGLYILSHVSCPAVLVECGFMSNFSDMENLKTSGYQTSVAAVLMGSYLQYITGIQST